MLGPDDLVTFIDESESLRIERAPTELLLCNGVWLQRWDMPRKRILVPGGQWDRIGHASGFRL